MAGDTLSGVDPGGPGRVQGAMSTLPPREELCPQGGALHPGGRQGPTGRVEAGAAINIRGVPALSLAVTCSGYAYAD